MRAGPSGPDRAKSPGRPPTEQLEAKITASLRTVTELQTRSLKVALEADSELTPDDFIAVKGYVFAFAGIRLDSYFLRRVEPLDSASPSQTTRIGSKTPFAYTLSLGVGCSVHRFAELQSKFIDLFKPSAHKCVPPVVLSTDVRVVVKYISVFRRSTCGPYSSVCTVLGVFERRWEAEADASEFCSRCVRALSSHPSFHHFEISPHLAAFERRLAADEDGQQLVSARTFLSLALRKNSVLDWLHKKVHGSCARQRLMEEQFPPLFVVQQQLLALAPRRQLSASVRAALRSGPPISTSRSCFSVCEKAAQWRSNEATIEVLPFHASMLQDRVCRNSDCEKSTFVVLTESLDAGHGTADTDVFAFADSSADANALVLGIGDETWEDRRDRFMDCGLRPTQECWPALCMALSDDEDALPSKYAAVYEKPLPAEAMFSSDMLSIGVKNVGDFGPIVNHPSGRGDPLIVHSKFCSPRGLWMHKQLDSWSGTDGIFIWAEQHFLCKRR